MARLDPRESFEILKDRVANEIKTNFPVEGAKHSLHVENVTFDDTLGHHDITDQKDKKIKGMTWGIPVKATFVLKDKTTGKEINRNTIKVATLPKITNRYSYIVDGTEYQVENQWRLKPGVYTRVKQNGELESRFNFATQRPLNMIFDPNTRIFRLALGGAKPALYPILKSVGVSDSDLEKSWGKDVLGANKVLAGGRRSPDSVVINFAKKVSNLPINNIGDASQALTTYFKEAKLRPDVTKITLGKEYENLSPEAITHSSRRLLGVARGEAPDVRDSLEFKDLMSVEDFIGERINKSAKTIQRRIKNNIDRRTRIGEIVGPDVFNQPIRDFFAKTSLANASQQVNPLEILSNQQKTTITGEGGISDANKVTEDAKLVDPSHFGFLDALHTPESDKTGVSLHLSIASIKKGTDVHMPVIDIKTGKTVLLRPDQIKNSIVALPDEGKWENNKWTPKGKKIKASIQNNEIVEVSPNEVQYIIPHATNMWSFATNLIPFLGNNSPNRTTMAGRQMEQAVSLKYREAPLVRVARDKNNTFDSLLGSFASHKSPIGGTVKKIADDHILITNNAGKEHKVDIYNNYPTLDKKGLLHATPVVKIGDKVTPGQLLADTNFTKDGVYAPGTHLHTAYTAWKGYNFEDGLVVSESAAKKLTSVHLYKKSVNTKDNVLLGKNKLSAYFPELVNKERLEKLDDDGVIRVGQKVKPGDVLIAAGNIAAPTTESDMLSKLRKSLIRPYNDKSVVWHDDKEGTVVDVSKHGKQVLVHVKTEEPLELGDKLCYDAETEVLTDCGWRKLDELGINDKVCCLNAKSNNIEYTEPSKFIKIPHYSGRAYSITTDKIDFMVTEDHNLVIDTKDCLDFIKASELENLKDSLICFNATGIRSLKYHSQIPQIITSPKNDEIILAIIAMYIMNGYIEIRHVREYHSDHVIFFIKDSFINKFRDVFSDVQYTETDTFVNNISCCKIKLNLRKYNLTELLQNNFEWVLDLHPEKIELFLKWLEIADVNWNNPYSDFLDIVAEDSETAGFIQQLLLHVGKYGIATEEGGKYRIKSYTSDEQPVYYSGDKYLNILEVKDAPFYCITVPTHILYVRRNGKPFWSGNCGRSGNKGIVANILPDAEMPRTKDGKVLDVLFNPIGIAGRMNTGQVLDVCTAKVAQKTGKHIAIKNFELDDARTEVESLLKSHNLKDKETIVDPVSGKEIPDITVGPAYFLKLQHQVDKKMVARSRAGYDRNLVPQTGGPHGGQALGALGIYAMLAHGAKCLHGSTHLRLSNGDLIEIKDFIREQHKYSILSYNIQDQRLEYKKVKCWSLRASVENEIIKIYTNETTLICTRGHKIYIWPETSLQPINQLVPAGDLEVGDYLSVLVMGRLVQSKITNIETYRPTNVDDSLVYNLDVDDNHNLLANNILVSNSNLREMSTLKSDKPQMDEMWTAIQTGEPIPPPKTTFAFDKFTSLLKGMGINVTKDGNSLNLSPLTDKHVLEISNGELKDAGRVIKGHSLTAKAHSGISPEESGLFDQKITGGLEGKHFSHITLHESAPNPIFESAIKSLTGIAGKDFDAVIEGKKAISTTGTLVEPKTGGSYTGPGAFEHALNRIDVKKEMALELERMKRLKGSNLNKSAKRYKFLRALEQLNMKPTEAYMMKHVPVIPPVMRPLTLLEDGRLQFEDINQLYKDVAVLDGRLKSMPEFAPNTTKSALRADIYDRLRALTGTGGTLKDTYKGIADIIAGDIPKKGFAQNVLIKRKQDLTLRSTIIPEPSLSLDQVMIPRKAAQELYKPFIVNELRNVTGATPLAAKQMVEQNHPAVKTVLDKIVRERPILIKRDPALHKYNIQAFNPILTESRAIKIHPLICSSFNADFDGDTVYGKVLVEIPPNICYKDSNKEAVSMPFIDVKVPTNIRCIELSEFPRIKDEVRTTKCGNIVYKVPEGVRVPAISSNRRISMYPVTEFSIHPNCEEWIVKTKNGRELFCTSDHSLVILNLETMQLEKAIPINAINKCAPVMRRLKGEASEDSFDIKQWFGPFYNTHANKVLESVEAGFDIGWFLGAFIGDGWAPKDGLVLSYGKGGEDVAAKWGSIAESLVDTTTSTTELPHDFEGKHYTSYRIQIHSVILSRWVNSIIPKGANRKDLPLNFLELPRSFRKGLFCGLIDTDGSVNWSNKQGASQQFSMNYTTISEDLARSVVLLGLSLGIHSSITEFTNREKPAYIITFSTRAVLDNIDWLRLRCVRKYEVLNSLREYHPDYGRNDFIPISDYIRCELIEKLREIGATKSGDNKNKAALSQYTVLSRTKDIITRTSIERLDDLIGKSEFTDLTNKWWKLALNKSVSWDLIESAEPTGEVKTMYDLTVPDAWTFAMMDGMFVWDTMSAYVPVTQEAVEEARRMYPSRIIFNPATSNIMYQPAHEAQVGLFMLSDINKKTNLEFKDKAELESAIKSGKLTQYDLAKVGNITTTLGRLKLTDTLPESMRNSKLLNDPEYRFTKKEQDRTFNEMARNDKNNFADRINKMKDLGNEAVTYGSFSFGLDDFKVHKDIRDPALKEAQEKTKGLDLKRPDHIQKFVDAYDEALKKIDSQLKVRATERSTTNSLSKLEVAAKIKGNAYRQLTTAPILFVDAKNNLVTSPVTKSYSEGLSTADYWAASSGGRKGIIQKTQETSKPGYLTKLMMNSTMNLTVQEEDCGTKQGISLPVDEPDIVGRYTSVPVKIGPDTIPADTIITPELLSNIKNAKITKLVVRSPMKCEHPKGLCKKCAGLDENGDLHDLGTNIGVHAAQALGERGTQLALKAFHHGGIFMGKTESDKNLAGMGLERAMTLLTMPKKIKGSAKLATSNGTITDIQKDPAGGVNVTISGIKHYVPADRQLLVKKGDTVSKGNPLTNGPINPHELLPLTNINTTQGYIAGELHSLYSPEGIRRRNSEVIVKALTNVTKIEDPGDHPTWVAGDFAPLTEVNRFNKEIGNKGKSVSHSPVIRGVKTIPEDVQTDWLARLNHENIKSTVIEAAQLGWRSQLHGSHPIPSLIYAAEFGKGTPDKPWEY